MSDRRATVGYVGTIFAADPHLEPPIQITNRSPYATHTTYDVTFFGDTIHTTVTADSSIVSDWIYSVRGSRPLNVGLDVEWRPSFTRGVQNPVATVQICVGRSCLIYQIIHSGGLIPRSLTEFFSDNDITFVGVGVQADLNKLQAGYGIGGEAQAEDPRWLAAMKHGRPEMKTAGLKALASMVLGRDFEKPRNVTVSNWANRQLTAEQVQYACVDAFVSYEIGRVLSDFLSYEIGRIRRLYAF